MTWYSKFIGLRSSDNYADAPQVSFQELDNFWYDFYNGGLTKRAGSYIWTQTGNILGIVGYNREGTNFKNPYTNVPIRHRRSGSTSYLETLDYATDTWSALTLGASTSFSDGGIMTAAQIGATLAIFAGRPAKLSAYNGTVKRLGGSAPGSAPTTATNGAGVLTGTAYHVYTFYDSTSGWESSPSPISTGLAVSSNTVRLSALATTSDREGVDKKRIYRQDTSDPEGDFQYVGEATLAATTFDDNVANASLGANAPDDGDHDPPPTTSYLGVMYANRFWVADGDELWYSKAFDGTEASLEYFSSNRVERFPSRITGLVYSPTFSRFLIFCPPGSGIHEIVGRSEETFENNQFGESDDGTEHPQSVAAGGEFVTYWGRSGPELLDRSGKVKGYGNNISKKIRPAISREYNSDVWVWSVWQPAYKKFFYGFAAKDIDGAAWGEAGATNFVEWQDAVTGATVDWEEP